MATRKSPTKYASTHIQKSVYINKEILARFQSIVDSSGMGISSALERCMMEAINIGHIPGVTPMTLEMRENEKFGTATPVYDGEEKIAKPQKGYKKVPLTPAE